MFEEMTPKQKDVLWVGGGLALATLIAIIVYEKSATAAPVVAPVVPVPVPVAPTAASSQTDTLLPMTAQPTSITAPLAIGAPLNSSVTLALPAGATWTSFAVAASVGASYSYVSVSGSMPYTFTYTGPGIATAAWTDSTGVVNTTYLSMYTTTG